MNGAQLRQKVVGDSFTRAAVILVLGIAGGGTGTTLIAQPRTDTEIRDIAEEQVAAERRVVTVELGHMKGDIEDIKEDVDEINGDIKEVLRRLPE